MNYHLLSLIDESAKIKEFILQDYFTEVGELKEYNKKLKKHNKNAYEIGKFCDKLLVKLIDVEE